LAVVARPLTKWTVTLSLRRGKDEEKEPSFRGGPAPGGGRRGVEDREEYQKVKKRRETADNREEPKGKGG